MDHVCDGHCADIITDPGKFEGEPRYVRDVLYPAVLDGLTDESTGEGPAVDWMAGIAPWGCDALDSRDVYGVALWEGDYGFVHHTLYMREDVYNDALTQAREEDRERALRECEACGGIGYIVGFLLGGVSNPANDIERCDACERYATDADALNAARASMIR